MSETRFQKTPFHYLQYVALKVFCVLFALLPYRFCVWTAQTLMGGTAVFFPRRFKRMEYDISRAFPQKTPQEVHPIAVDSWRNMGTILAEFIQLTHMSREKFKKHCRIVGLENILRGFRF